jgi:hypothetical protein
MGSNPFTGTKQHTMKKLLFLIFLLPLFASAQKDFDYSFLFTKRIVYTVLSPKKIDSVITDGEFIVTKKRSKLVVTHSTDSAKSYNILFLSVQDSSILFYMNGINQILVNPIAPAIRISNRESVILYTNE